METGFAAWRLAKALYIVPFLFVYTQFLFEEFAHEVLITAIDVTMGLLALTATMEGYFVRRRLLWERAPVGLATIGLLWPHTTPGVVSLIMLGFTYLAPKLASRRRVLNPAREKAYPGA